MLYHVSSVAVGFEKPQDEALENELRKRGFLALAPGSYRILKKSLDCRKKESIQYLYQLEVQTDAPLKPLPEGVKPAVAVETVERKALRGLGDVVVVGAGPAGLFAALRLAELGLRPLILERGKKVHDRSQDVEKFWSQSLLDPESNMQFGEGGAGTFSDGKLTTRIQNPLIDKVFNELVEAGAPPEILYDYKPHVGTDLLIGVVARLRKKIEGLGGTFRFDTKLEDWRESEGKITHLVLAHGEVLPVDRLILATGHSARDTFRMIHRHGVSLEAKPFAVGTRIEHPQELINQMQYGSHWQDPRLPAATYSFTHNFEAHGRRKGVFTFCMCPGGEVVSAASETGGTLVNGMSESRRDGPFANSAVVVTVGPEDFGSGTLDGMLFQRKLEEGLYQAAGGFGSVYQRLEDFQADRTSRGSVESSFRMGLAGGNLRQTLPPVVSEGLLTGFQGWSRVRSFVHPSAVLIGHETRTSSPLRILRGEGGNSLTHRNLFPAGEGAGYAGGIVSAAVDGLKVVEAGFTKADTPTY